jgi:hypothetical protein
MNGSIMTGIQQQQQHAQQQRSIMPSLEPVLSTTNQFTSAESRGQSKTIEETLEFKRSVGARGFCLRDKDEITSCQQTQEAALKKSGAADYVQEGDITQFDVVFVGRGGNGYQSLMGNEIHRGYIWYRCILEKLKPAFQAVFSKSGKIRLSRWVVKKIKEFGGRFLIKDKEENRYEMISDRLAQMRTSMSLRDRRIWKTLDETC